MDKAHQVHHQWWRLRWLNYKYATIVICLFNLLTALFLLQSYLFASSRHPNSAQFHLDTWESEEIRRSLIPVDLIKRVSEIRSEASVEPKTAQNKNNKPGTAVNLVSRLNNFRSYSDSGSVKALEEWRKRKMERARQRELGKNGTAI